MKPKLANPALIATTANKLAPAINNTVQSHNRTHEKSQDFLMDNIKPILITSAIFVGVIFGPKLYKSWRRKTYAKNNIGKPHVVAAGIIYSSMHQITPTGIFAWIFPEIKLWTDDKYLLKVASEVNDIKEVSRAYYILFDRVLQEDINRLSKDNIRAFYALLGKKTGNPDIKRIILNGVRVYAAQKNPIQVKKAVYKNGKWVSTNEVYGTFSFSEEVGTVHTSVKYNNQSRFYIVKKGVLFNDYGLVWDNQIRDTKP